MTFNILNNILYYRDYDLEGNYKYLDNSNLDSEKKIIEEELKRNISDSKKQVELKTQLDIINLQKNYQYGSWQYNKVKDYLYNIVECINIYTYQVNDLDYLKMYQQRFVH